MRFLPAVSMLLVTVALTSCDAHQPLQSEGRAVSPDPQAGAVTSKSGGGSQLVGTYTAPTTWATPGRVTTYQPLTPTGITLAPNRYFLLRIGDIMQVEANPYTAGAVPGNVLHSYSAYESSQSTGRGLTRVTLADGSRTSGMLLSGFRVDEGGEDMILLVRAGPEGSNLLAERWMMPGRDLKWGYCPLRPYCPHDEVLKPDTVFRIAITIEDYWISVPHVVSATEIFEPLTLDAGPLVPGTPMTVQALPFAGLRIRTREGFPAGLRWLWYPGDTASTPNPYISGHTPAGCSDKMVCEFTPTKAGRMVVSTTLEGADVRVSRVLKVQESKLVLTCPESVERGEEMTCTVAAEPSGTLTDIQWEFVDSAGGVNAGPAGPTWGGRMAVSGQMDVRAVLNGESASATAKITVRPRRWPRLRLAVLEENPNHLPPPVAVTTSGELGDGHVDPLPSYPGARINEGPNEGWWYFDRPLPDIPVGIHINYPAFQQGSAWYNLQAPGIWTDPTTGTKHPHCRRSDVPTLLTITRQHEGSVASSGGQVSHVDAMQRYLAANAPQDFFEALLRTDSQIATQTFDDQVRAYYRWKVIGDLTGTTQHKPEGQTDRPVFPCMPRFF